MPNESSGRQWMTALARLRGQAARMRTSSASTVADALDLADAALNLIDDVRAECSDLRRRSIDIERELRRHDEVIRKVLDALPTAVVTTDRTGIIVDVNKVAAALLGRSVPKLRDQLLLHFFDDRAAFTGIVHSLRDTPPADAIVLRMRPRERAPVDVSVSLAPDPRDGESRWLWFLSRISDPKTSPRTIAPPPSAAPPSDLAEI